MSGVCETKGKRNTIKTLYFDKVFLTEVLINNSDLNIYIYIENEQLNK